MWGNCTAFTLAEGLLNRHFSDGLSAKGQYALFRPFVHLDAHPPERGDVCDPLNRHFPDEPRFGASERYLDVSCGSFMSIPRYPRWGRSGSITGNSLLPLELPGWADCVAKLFWRPKCATLIQGRAPARNIDSRRDLFGFDCCAFAAQHRVLQHNRPAADHRGNQYSPVSIPPVSA